MAITDTSYTERVLIVLNPDGSLKGVHQERLREVRDGNSLLSASQLPAEPLAAETLAAVLPQQAALLAQIAALVVERDAAVAEAAALRQPGASPAPSDVIDGVPQQVTNYQARSALIIAGMFEAVDAAVKAQGPGSQAYQAWEYANVYLRSSPFIAEMGATLGLTSEQIDALFVAAAQVT